jgi:excisionase family DNA binding protein
MEKTVMNFNDLATYTGLSKSYLYKLSAKGVLPSYKPFGKILFFDKAEVDAFLRQNKSKQEEGQNG